MKIFNTLLIYVFFCSIISVFCEQSYDAPLPLQAKYQLNKRQGTDVEYEDKLPAALGMSNLMTVFQKVASKTFKITMKILKKIIGLVTNNHCVVIIKNIVKTILNFIKNIFKPRL